MGDYGHLFPRQNELISQIFFIDYEQRDRTN